MIKNVRGEPMGLSSVIQWHVPQIMKRAGLVKSDGTHRYTCHALRHFAGSAWLAQGMPIDEVSRLLCHSRIETTRKIYIHQLEHDTRAKVAIERVAALVTGKPMPAILSSPAVVPMIEQQPAAADVGLPVPIEVAPVAAPDFTTKGFREMQRQRAQQQWKDGHSAAEIGRELGVSYATATHWIQEAHGNLRRAVRNRSFYENMTPEQREEKRRQNRERYRRMRAKTKELRHGSATENGI